MSLKSAKNFTKVHSIKKQYTLDEMSAALTRNNGRIYTTARELNITARAIYNRIDAHPELQDVINDARGYIIDLAESTLESNIKNGDTAAAIWVTRTLGKERGYTERQEITGKDGGAITLKVVYEDKA